MEVWNGQDLISAENLEKKDILQILERAMQLLPVAKKEKTLEILKGKILSTIFFEPSTRTRLSFETAMLRLGGQVLSTGGPEVMSISKGETLEDTAKVLSYFADIVAIRHPEIGSATRFAAAADIPVINAGDGSGEHPTQAMLDLLTILIEKRTLDDLTVAVVGDLKFGRAAHSFSVLLSNFKVKFVFVSPEALKMPEKVKEILKKRNVDFEETEDFAAALRKSDIVYVTRVQRERFEDLQEYEKYKSAFVLDRALVEANNPAITILHPLPRVTELAVDLDDLPGAAYFRQVQNGIAVRMAILTLLLGVEL